MKPDTKAIMARADAATAGPWHSGSWGRILDKPDKDPLSATVAECLDDKANQEFVMHARADVPALCDRVDALEAALRREISCETGAPDDARCRSCRACVRLAEALEGDES